MPPQTPHEHRQNPEYDTVKHYELKGPGPEGGGRGTVITGTNTRLGLDIEVSGIDGLDVPESYDVAARVDLGTPDASVMLLRDLNEVFGPNPKNTSLMRAYLAMPDGAGGSKLVGEITHTASSPDGATIGRELLEHEGSYDEATKSLVDSRHVTISINDGQAIIHDRVSENGTQITKKGPHNIF